MIIGGAGGGCFFVGGGRASCVLLFCVVFAVGPADWLVFVILVWSCLRDFVRVG